MDINKKASIKPCIFSLVLGCSLILGASSYAAKPDFPGINLPAKANGEKAIKSLGGRLPDVAAYYGMTTAEFAKTLRTDKSAWVDTRGRLFYVEEEIAGQNVEAPVAAAPYPYADTFKLHSKPGSKRVIYLDFDGHTIFGTAWANGQTIESPPYDKDKQPGSFSTAEMDEIQNIWLRVAEDFAPFDVNVTTEYPTESAIIRSSSTDQIYGTRVLITTRDSRLCDSCGGVAYVGTFDLVKGVEYQPAYVFYDALGGSARNIAEAASHEAGHNLGLRHDGNSVAGYYSGHGSGATGWAPIMGVGYYRELTQWSRGEYFEANQLQDDYIAMHSNGALPVSDDHSDVTDASATAVTTSAGAVAGKLLISGSGVISTPDDVDVFRFESGAGDISIDIGPAASIGTNLDIEATLFDSVGNELLSSNPADLTTASISLGSQAAGVYYLKIDGAGKHDPYVDGYTDYGSLGQYVISGTIAESSLLKAPQALISTNTTSGNAPLVVSFDGRASTDEDGSIVDYSWDFGDGSLNSMANHSHTYDMPGDYNATLTVTDNDGLSSSANMTINVFNQTPVAKASADLLSGQAPLRVNFSSAGSHDPDAMHTLAYRWDFADGGSSTAANPSHQYTAAGNYAAILTVEDNLGAKATATVNIAVEANPDLPPVAPFGLTASVRVDGKGKNKVKTATLQWQDSSNNEDYFLLERCEEVGKGKRKSCDFAVHAVLPAGATLFIDGSLRGVYKYRVRARNAHGLSAYTNEVKI